MDTAQTGEQQAQNFLTSNGYSNPDPPILAYIHTSKRNCLKPHVVDQMAKKTEPCG